MPVLSKTEEKLIRDEIAIWSKHQELDKFNYNDMAVKLLGSLALIVALITILVQAPESVISRNLAGRLEIALTALALILFLIYRYRMNVANAHFMRREQMIDEWYGKLGVNKEELIKEFRKGYRRPCWLF